jgi:hypothetical protein
MPVKFTAGRGLTITVIMFNAVHPFASVTVTEYVVVVVGATVAEEAFPPEGAHKYV